MLRGVEKPLKQTFVIILSSLLLFVMTPPARGATCEPPAGSFEQQLEQAITLKQSRACRQMARVTLETLYRKASENPAEVPIEVQIKVLYQLGAIYDMLNDSVRAASC